MDNNNLQAHGGKPSFFAIPSGFGSASAKQHGHPVDFLRNSYADRSEEGPRAAIGFADSGGNPYGEHGPALSSWKLSLRRVSSGTSCASEEAGAAFLGTYAESSPTPQKRDKKEGEKWDQAAVLKERYALQAVARKAMFEAFYRVPKEERPKHPHRVVECRRSLRPVPEEKGKFFKPAIFRHKATGNTFYAGHQICASGRACPLCAGKIGETRAEEIRKAVYQWVQDGGICLFVTPTFPHYAKDSLQVLVESFQGALKRFRKGASFDRLKEALGYVGIIRSLETTWGEANGWHPHSHEIWFCRPEEGLRERLLLAAKESRQHWIETGKKISTGELLALKHKLYEKWRAAVVASGLSEPSFERGLHIEVAETEEECRSRLAEYMAKTGLEFDESQPVWGVDDELVKVHSKRGKPGRFTPFDFLREQYNPENDKTRKVRYRQLFAEFVEEFKGMAQVYWSPGLKARFDLKEISDEDAAEESKEPSTLLTEIAPPIWAFVIGIEDYRAQLLVEAKEKGALGVREYLSSLLDQYYLIHYESDFEHLSHDARYLLALPESSFVSTSGNSS